MPACPHPVRDSTSTYGLRFAGEKPVGKIKLAYVASYATQSDYARQSAQFRSRLLTRRVHRHLSSVQSRRRARRCWKATAVRKGFTTPLATLHKFQGWADKFLTTPPNGIEDLYVNAGVTLKGVGRSTRWGSS